MATNRELSQNQLIDYLKDVSDIEVREFTLRKAIDELKYQQIRFKSNEEMQAHKEIAAAQKNLNQAKKELLRGRPYLETIFQNPPTEPQKPSCWSEYEKATQCPLVEPKLPSWGWVFLLPVVWVILSLVIGIPLILIESRLPEGLISESLLNAIFSPWLICILGAVLTLLFALIPFGICLSKGKKYSQYEKLLQHRKELQNAVSPYQKERSLYEHDCQAFAAYQTAVKRLAEKEAALSAIEKERKAYKAVLDRQIAALQPHIVTLFNQKYALYDLNIIPPDYRTLDCVLMLHQIFRNGLKDNMAEAVLLYEERVFRQEVIRGIDKIYEMLGDLNASMRAVEERLIDVRQEVQMMGNDLCGRLEHMAAQAEKSAQNQEMWMDSQERWQEDLLSETRASRYAAEAVQNSNYKYEWYMEQHRQGLL